MNFKQWLNNQFNEIVDIANADVSDVKLTIDGDGSYHSHFVIPEQLSDGSYDDANYYVAMAPIQDQFHNVTLQGYEIQFIVDSAKTRSEGGFNLSGSMGSKATTIYNKILLIIKKFMQEVQQNKKHPAQFLTFMGQSARQDIMYNNFVQKGLLAKGYTRVRPDMYVRNDILQDIKNTHGTQVDDTVKSGQAEYDQHLANARQKLAQDAANRRQNKIK